MTKLYNISELSKILNLIDPKTKKPQNHILRYWEKEFREIRPKKINNRRYYSLKQVETIKLIKFLLKDQGLTINGAKNILKLDTKKLDDLNLLRLKANYYKFDLKKKTKTILQRLKRLRKYGKKISHQS